MKCVWLVLGTALLVVPSAGCGGKSPVKLVPVSGTITTQDGKPVANAVVKFSPTDKTKEIAPTSTGTTDKEGKFTLETVEGHEGAMPGEHSVSITLEEGDNEEDDTGEGIKSLIPAKYNTETTLKITVGEEGTDSADFKVELRKPKK